MCGAASYRASLNDGPRLTRKKELLRQQQGYPSKTKKSWINLLCYLERKGKREGEKERGREGGGREGREGEREKRRGKEEE